MDDLLTEAEWADIKTDEEFREGPESPADTEWEKESEGPDTAMAEASGEEWSDIEPAASGGGPELSGGGGGGEAPKQPKPDVDASGLEKGTEDTLGGVPEIGGMLKGGMETILGGIKAVGGFVNKGSRAGSATAFTQGGGGGGSDQLSSLISAIKKSGGGKNRL